MLESGWIRVVDGTDSRRKVYSLTDAGRAELDTELRRLDDIVSFARDQALFPHQRTSD